MLVSGKKRIKENIRKINKETYFMFMKDLQIIGKVKFSYTWFLILGIECITSNNVNRIKTLMMVHRV